MLVNDVKQIIKILCRLEQTRKIRNWLKILKLGEKQAKEIYSLVLFLMQFINQTRKTCFNYLS
jgi:hypothetical protein